MAPPGATVRPVRATVDTGILLALFLLGVVVWVLAGIELVALWS